MESIIILIIFFFIAFLILKETSFFQSPQFICAVFYCILLSILISTSYSKQKNTKYYYTKEEIKQEAKIDTQLMRQEVKYLDKMQQLFNDYKTTGDDIVFSNIAPNFSLRDTIIRGERRIQAIYSYREIPIQVKPNVTFPKKNKKSNKLLKTTVSHYKPGTYRVYDSYIAEAITLSVEATIDSFLSKNLEKGEEVQLSLHGCSDVLGFKNPRIYENPNYTFPIVSRFNEEVIDKYELNGKLTPIQLTKGDTLDNANLAFLRAYFLFEDKLKNIIPLRKVKKKMLVTYHATTATKKEEKGGQFRKVKIGIDIINPTGLFPAPPNMPCKGIKLWIANIFILFSTIAIGFLFVHYKIYRETIQHNIKNRELQSCIIAFLLAIGLLLASWWMCPILLLG